MAVESERVREAQKLAKTNPKQAEAKYKEIISKPPSITSETAVREYETALIALGELYRDQKCAPKVTNRRRFPTLTSLGTRKRSSIWSLRAGRSCRRSPRPRRPS